MEYEYLNGWLNRDGSKRFRLLGTGDWTTAELDRIKNAIGYHIQSLETLSQVGKITYLEGDLKMTDDNHLLSVQLSEDCSATITYSGQMCKEDLEILKKNIDLLMDGLPDREEIKLRQDIEKEVEEHYQKLEEEQQEEDEGNENE